jgi:hypothetical protein
MSGNCDWVILATLRVIGIGREAGFSTAAAKRRLRSKMTTFLCGAKD